MQASHAPLFATPVSPLHQCDHRATSGDLTVCTSVLIPHKPILQGRLGSGYEPLRPRYAIINGEIIGGFCFGFGPGGNPLVSSYSSPEGSSVAPDGSSKEEKRIDTKKAGSGEGLAGYRPSGILAAFSSHEGHPVLDEFEPSLVHT